MSTGESGIRPAASVPAGSTPQRHPERALVASTAASLRVEHLRHAYGPVRVLDDVSWQAGVADVLCLLGPSGSGKSTLLRLVAGLEAAQSGRVLIGDEEVSGPLRFVAPERRGVGLMFQDHALFPHLTVLANVMFGLRGGMRAQARATALNLLERVGLSHRADSHPHTLSGGEQQRVALARALAPAPRVLLMDEPFSSLDRGTRDRVRAETLSVLREAARTAVVVTHDPEEAMHIADSIVLLREGRVEQVGDPRTLWERPASLFAARFFGDWNELDASCRDGYADTLFGRFPAARAHAGARVKVCIRAQGFRIDEGGVALTVRERVFLGESEQVQVVHDALPAPLVVRIAPHRCPPVGQVLHLAVDASAVRVYADPPHLS